MCGIKKIVPEGHMNDCGCGVRKLFTRQEKIEKLRQYQKELEQELLAVKEMLQSMTQE
jgi:hypothetical protein